MVNETRKMLFIAIRFRNTLEEIEDLGAKVLAVTEDPLDAMHECIEEVKRCPFDIQHLSMYIRNGEGAHIENPEKYDEKVLWALLVETDLHDITCFDSYQVHEYYL